MKKTELDKMFKEAFGFLFYDFSFSVISSKKENWGYKLVATNSTTGIEIVYEFREAYIQISIYRLIDGKIVKNINNAIKTDEPITGFGLGWIIELKNPKARIKPVYEYGIDSLFYNEKDGRKNYVEFVASSLKEYASDILSGDFSSFSELDTMVKKHFTK